jgi:hypothetical protein
MLPAALPGELRHSWLTGLEMHQCKTSEARRSDALEWLGVTCRTF